MRHSPAKTSKAASISLLALLLCSPALASDPPKHKPKSAIEERSSFNLAKLSAEARVVYVSSGSLILARRVIDGNATTDFSFSSSDFYPTVVVELAQTQRLNKVTAICDIEGRLDVYLLNQLSGDGADVSKNKPVASVAAPVSGKAAVDFEPRGARYVALRWTRKKPVTGGCKVAEVGAFCVGSSSVFDWLQPASFVQSTIHMTSNGGPDFSNSFGTLADSPTIPPVSP